MPAGDLATALALLAKQSGVEMMYSSERLKGLGTAGVHGEYTAEAAAVKLLEGTNLKLRVHESGGLLISDATGSEAAWGMRQISQGVNAHLASSGAVASSGSDSQGSESRDEDAKKKIDSSAEESGSRIQEIVVTAQKREERLQDVPVPVTVLSATTLAENNQPRLRDYFSSIPGFSISPAPSSGNHQMLAIRGVSSGSFGNPTVGVTVDDVPYGAFTREFAPDIDPSDLARIEVLRGPQGTLYGASTMGGLLKFVTVDPSTERLSGRVEGGTSSVQNGDGLGYSFRGSVNVPVSDVFAVRASAFTRRDPGYIDNPLDGRKGLNEINVEGGRLSALWNISDTFSLKLSALYQHTKGDGVADIVVQPGLGELQQNYIPGIGAYDQTNQAYSAIFKGKLGSIDVASITGYNVYKFSSSNDLTYLLGSTAQRLLGVSGSGIFNYNDTRKFSQEIRASIPIGRRVEWLVGGFYTHENIPFTQVLKGQDPVTGAIVGDYSTGRIPIKHTEYAAFTDVTVHFTERFNIQFGGRESYLREAFEPVTNSGLLYGGGTAVTPGINVRADVFTYLVTPQFKVSPDLMTYARIASGYRPGRSNSGDPNPRVPRSPRPDKTQNYEIGVKGNLLDRILSFDASLYYIKWEDIQIQLTDRDINPLTNQPYNFGYYTNGSAAKSAGVELSVEARPLTGLTIAAWGTYDDAVLTESFPANSPAYGPEGARLPFGTRLSGNLSADQAFPVTDTITGFGGFTLSYVGEREGTFTPTSLRAIYPAYTRVDVRAGARFDSWQVNLYANNVTDRRGLLGGGVGNFPPYAFIYIQPRSMGISVSRTF